MPVWYLVPDGVVQYIEKRSLYGSTARRGGSGGTRRASAGPEERSNGGRPTYDRPPADAEPGPDPRPPTNIHQEVPR
jgi:nicotinate-nucleotide adenylyltransferase